MAGFDPSNITLTNIYTDPSQLGTKTDVYGNGKMQAMVFPAANYNGDATSSEIIENVKKYIAENTKIYVYTTTGGTEPLTWKKSTVSNEFIHDIYSGSATTSSTTTSDDTSPCYIRVPIYFVVPVGELGKYHWIAELDGQRTAIASPVTVICHQLSLTTENFVVTDVATTGLATLRALRYNLIGSISSTSLKLVKCLSYKGLKFTTKLDNLDKPIPATTVVSVSDPQQQQMGCFILYKESSASVALSVDYPFRLNSYVYDKPWPSVYQTIDCNVDNKSIWINSSTSGFPSLNPLDISKASIDDAWDLGIAMIRLDKTFIKDGPNRDNFELSLQGFHLEDNCGNFVKVDFDWHDKHPWTIKDCSIFFDN